jgi:hypothetical protein
LTLERELMLRQDKFLSMHYWWPILHSDSILSSQFHHPDRGPQVMIALQNNFINSIKILWIKGVKNNAPDLPRSAETDRTSGSSRLRESSRPGVPGSTDLDRFLDRLRRSFRLRKKDRLRERPLLRSAKNSNNTKFYLKTSWMRAITTFFFWTKWWRHTTHQRSVLVFRIIIIFERFGAIGKTSFLKNV